MPPGVQWHDDHRLSLDLTTADRDAFDELERDGANSVVVLDWTSGAYFKVNTADCGADCFCAAEARWVTP
jgi:hypothetical protein